MTKALTVFQPKTLKEFVEVGNIFATSGYFDDARAGAQAIVKIMAGSEMGLGLFESMNGFHIIKGKMTMAANLIATLVKRAEGYDYKVLHLDSTACSIEFFHDDESLGVSEFTIDDAQQAGLVKSDGSWKKWPKNMLFARAISNGVRFYCPEVTNGSPVYTPDELGAEVDEHGEIVDASFEISKPGEQYKNTVTHWSEEMHKSGDGTNGEVLAEKFNFNICKALGVIDLVEYPGTAAEAYEALTTYEALPDANIILAALHEACDGDDGEAITDKQKALLAMKLNELVGDSKRHELMHYVFGVSSSSELTKKQASALIDWALSDGAKEQAEMILRSGALQQGQVDMFGAEEAKAKLAPEGQTRL